jgi:hypothetical protein
LPRHGCNAPKTDGNEKKISEKILADFKISNPDTWPEVGKIILDTVKKI